MLATRRERLDGVKQCLVSFPFLTRAVLLPLVWAGTFMALGRLLQNSEAPEKEENKEQFHSAATN